MLLPVAVTAKNLISRRVAGIFYRFVKTVSVTDYFTVFSSIVIYMVDDQNVVILVTAVVTTMSVIIKNFLFHPVCSKSCVASSLLLVVCVPLFFPSCVAFSISRYPLSSLHIVF